MRNPRPIIARCIRGPLNGKTFRVKRGQREMTHYSADGRAHLYELAWPAPADAVLELLANYRGTRKR